MKPRFRGTIDYSRSRVWPIIYDADLVAFHKHFESFSEGEHVFVTIEKITKKKIRSLEQNAYYWGVVVKMLSDYTGYSKDETHQALKIQFLTYENVPGMPTTLSTRDLKTEQFEAYLEQIRRWASMYFGLVIPEPNQVDFVE